MIDICKEIYFLVVLTYLVSKSIVILSFQSKLYKSTTIYVRELFFLFFFNWT